MFRRLPELPMELSMVRNKLLWIATSLVFASLIAPAAEARGYRGGSGSFSGGRGGRASWSDGSGSASGAYGSSASWSNGAGSITGRNGGTASWGNGSGSYTGA